MSNLYRIIGPPGTGKSTTLAKWIGKASERYGPEGVMVTSFTKTAAHEIKSRGIDVAPGMAGTLHSICFRAIAQEEGMKIAETVTGEEGGWNSRFPHWAITPHGASRRMDDPCGAGIAPSEGEGDELLGECGLERAKLTPVDQWGQKAQAFWKEWHEWKMETGHYDFTDLIEYARDAYDTAPGEPQAIFCDETQDMNPLQLSLLKKWGEAAEFYVTAGDADQTLFTFAGCSPEAFLSPELPADRERVLSQSYRVPRAAHAAAMKMIRKCTKRREVEYLPTGVLGSYTRSAMNRNHGRSLTEEVERLLALPDVDDGKGGMRKPTVMVLASCNYHLNSVVSGLRNAGVAFHNPFRPAAGNWNPLRGGGERLRDFLVPHLDGRLWNWAELARWTEFVSARSGVFAKGAKSLIKAQAKQARYEGGARASLTSMECRRVITAAGLEDAQQALREGRGARWIIQHSTKRGQELFGYAARVAEKSGYQGLVEAPRVVVGTAHSVKGGEADHVIISPDLSPAGSAEWWGGQRDPILRMAYVAITRARHSVTVLAPTSDRSIPFPESEAIAAGLAAPF